MGARDQDEMAVFLIGVLKRLLYAFDRLDEVSQTADPASPKIALYFDSVYNYTSLLFLLDAKGRPMGGSAYLALQQYGLESLLDPVKALLDEPFGSTTFGNAIRVLRNDAIVHSGHGDGDFDRVYSLVNMSSQENQMRWQQLLWRLRDEIGRLSVNVARSTGRPLQDFGFS